MVSVTIVEIVQSADLDRIAAFYRAAGYGGGVSADDITLVATAEEGIVGVVRLCREAGVTVLRGMQVDAAFQRQGIGRTLLRHCLPHLGGGVAYCLPYAHLAAFYGEAGFVPVTPAMLPPFLAERLAGYLRKGQSVIAMRRSGANHMPNRSCASRMA
jgi:predicted N-acetyltransferase YhbS